MLPRTGPYESISPIRDISRKVMVILWDPHYPGVERPSVLDVEKAVFGDGRSVRNYFLENSGGKFTIEPAGVYGWYEAEHPLEWYDGTPGHDKMGAALRAANTDVDFALFDTNHDGTLDATELCLAFAHPGGGQSPGGLERIGDREIRDLDGGPLVLNGVRIRHGIELGTGFPVNVGVFVHELCHILLKLGDMYFTFYTSTGAGPYSVMDQHWTSPHIDPFQKLKLGWLQTRLATKTGRYSLGDVETTHEALVLLDPSRKVDEYFLVENRWRGSSFDSVLPDQGIAVWHIMENPADYASAPAPPYTDPVLWADLKTQWPRSAIRMIRPVITPPYDPARALWDGADAATGYDLVSNDPDPAHPSLKWSDGKPSGFALRFASASKVAQVDVSVSFQPERGNLLHLVGVTSDGHLWHTVRFPGDWYAFGDVELAAGERGSLKDVNIASVNREMHVCAVNTAGRLWHATRNTDGLWSPFALVGAVAGEPGVFVRVSAADMLGELHVCAVTADGRLWHACRRTNGTWSDFTDVAASGAGDRGRLVDVDVAVIGSDLHVAITTADGRLWHTIRRSTGWLAFNDVEGQCGERGLMSDVTCAAVLGQLHLCAVSADGHLWHALRRPNGSWTAFVDIEQTAGDRGSICRVSAGDCANRLHVAAVTTAGGLWHSIRRADGSFYSFGDVERPAQERGVFQTVSIDGLFIPAFTVGGVSG